MKIFFRDTRTPELAGLSGAQLRETRILAQKLFYEERKWAYISLQVILIGPAIFIALTTLRIYRELLPTELEFLAFVFAPLTAALPVLVLAPLDIHMKRRYFLQARKTLPHEASA